MPTSSLKAIPGGRGMIAYCLSPKGKLKREPRGERVQFVHSSFLSGDDPDGIAEELKFAAGKKADSYHFRIAFAPTDRKLHEQEFRHFVEAVAAEIIPDRNFIAVCHGDCHHQHLHIVSAFLDDQDRALNFRGKGKYAFAVQRQAAVDKAAAALGLSVVPRDPGTFNAAKTRVPLGVVRAAEAGKYIWTVDLKRRINAARKASSSIPEFIANLDKQGVVGRLRGEGISFDFVDKDGKKRIARGRKLGKAYELASINNYFEKRRIEMKKDMMEKESKDFWPHFQGQEARVNEAAEKYFFAYARRAAAAVGIAQVEEKKGGESSWEAARALGVGAGRGVDNNVLDAIREQLGEFPSGMTLAEKEKAFAEGLQALEKTMKEIKLLSLEQELKAEDDLIPAEDLRGLVTTARLQRWDAEMFLAEVSALFFEFPRKSFFDTLKTLKPAKPMPEPIPEDKDKKPEDCRGPE